MNPIQKKLESPPDREERKGEIIMTTQEMIAKVTEIAENTELFYVGIRFEDKKRTIGEIIEECSKDNRERQDERDFPEYGTTEYDELPELNGVCAYSCIS